MASVNKNTNTPTKKSVISKRCFFFFWYNLTAKTQTRLHFTMIIKTVNHWSSVISSGVNAIVSPQRIAF